VPNYEANHLHYLADVDSECVCCRSASVGHYVQHENHSQINSLYIADIVVSHDFKIHTDTLKYSKKLPIIRQQRRI